MKVIGIINNEKGKYGIMNISNQYNIFQQINKKNTFHKKIGLENPLNNLLNKVADKSIRKQENASDRVVQLNTEKLNRDTYSKIETSESLEKLPSELLYYYAGSLKFLSALSHDHEKELGSFKEKLQSFDNKLQTYYAIQNGTEDIPDGFTMDEINNLLIQTQQERDKYFEDGIKKINKWDIYKSDFFNRTMNNVFGENKYTKSDANWEVNSKASNIYAEIDKVINSTNGLTQTLNEGISRIYNILEKRGYSIEEYKLDQTLSSKNIIQNPDTESTNFEFLFSSLKNKAYLRYLK